jgi:hypothetical protein
VRTHYIFPSADLVSKWSSWIASEVERLWTELAFKLASSILLLGNCQESGEGLNNRRPQQTLGFLTWKQAKALIQDPSERKTRGLLNLDRDQLWWVVGLLIGHYHLKGHFFKPGLVNSPRCQWCLEKAEWATNILLWLWLRGNSLSRSLLHGLLLHGT